jgi:hypothetical protein
MYRTLAPFALLLFAGIAAAEERHLTQAVGPVVSVKNKGQVVEYCPDNTCEVFSLGPKGTSAVLRDFALAYLYSVSGYVYLADFQSRTDLPEVAALLVRYQDKCPQTARKAAVHCVAAHLARTHPVRVSFVRYDERRRHVVPVSLDGLRNAI